MSSLCWSGTESPAHALWEPLNTAQSFLTPSYLSILSLQHVQKSSPAVIGLWPCRNVPNLQRGSVEVRNRLWKRGWLVLMKRNIRVPKKTKTKPESQSLSSPLSLLMLDFNCPEQCNDLFTEANALGLVEKCKAQAGKHKTKETNMVWYSPRQRSESLIVPKKTICYFSMAITIQMLKKN